MAYAHTDGGAACHGEQAQRCPVLSLSQAGGGGAAATLQLVLQGGKHMTSSVRDGHQGSGFIVLRVERAGDEGGGQAGGAGLSPSP